MGWAERILNRAAQSQFQLPNRTVATSSSPKDLENVLEGVVSMEVACAWPHLTWWNLCIPASTRLLTETGPWSNCKETKTIGDHVLLQPSSACRAIKDTKVHFRHRWRTCSPESRLLGISGFLTGLHGYRNNGPGHTESHRTSPCQAVPWFSIG